MVDGDVLAADRPRPRAGTRAGGTSESGTGQEPRSSGRGTAARSCRSGSPQHEWRPSFRRFDSCRSGGAEAVAVEAEEVGAVFVKRLEFGQPRVELAVRN